MESQKTTSTLLFMNTVNIIKMCMKKDTKIQPRRRTNTIITTRVITTTTRERLVPHTQIE